MIKKNLITVSVIIAVLFGRDFYQLVHDTRLAPRLLNYQGYLTDTLGNPISSPPMSMTFSIYNVVSGGSPLWTEYQDVEVTKGIFHAVLGVMTAIPDSVFTQGANRWLEVTVLGSTLSPRTRITAVPYALEAVRADTAGYARATVSDSNWIRTGNDQYSGVSGNVGIGTNTPSFKLQVIGSICGGTFCTASNPYSGVLAGWNNQAGYADIDTAAVCVGGWNNRAYNKYSFIGGGRANYTGSLFSSTVSGLNNTSGNDISDTAAVITGGINNLILGKFGFIGGGSQNDVEKPYGAISGGSGNFNNGEGAFIGGGWNNTVNGTYAIISGGIFNQAMDSASVVGGGQNNRATAKYSFIGGGANNQTRDKYAVVSGGAGNNADSMFTTVAGGQNNQAVWNMATVGGGANNIARMPCATVGGGYLNTADSSWSFIGGGYNNQTQGYYATIGGGYNNRITHHYGIIGGGYYNYINDQYSVIAGGDHNLIAVNGFRATVGGGFNNYVSAYVSTVGGGEYDSVFGAGGFAAGSRSIIPFGYNNSAVFNGQVVTASGQTRVNILSKASGTFSIDHPLDPRNKILNHYFVESPEMVLIYRGIVRIGNDGRAIVHLPDYFDALNKNPMVQLTAVGTPETPYLVENVKENQFIIAGKPGSEVHWLVTGERKDISAEATKLLMPVEQTKTGDLSSRSLDDNFLYATMAQLEAMGYGDRFSFRTSAAKERYEEFKKRIAENTK